jgi:hypothetical protein
VTNRCHFFFQKVKGRKSGKCSNKRKYADVKNPKESSADKGRAGGGGGGGGAAGVRNEKIYIKKWQTKQYDKRDRKNNHNFREMTTSIRKDLGRKRETLGGLRIIGKRAAQFETN